MNLAVQHPEGILILLCTKLNTATKMRKLIQCFLLP